MELLPEWAPSAHPLVIHFPIVLLVAAVFCDLGAFVWRKHSSALRTAAGVLYVLGAVTAGAAFLSGRRAADAVFPEAEVGRAITEHADWAKRLVWFWGVTAVLRLAVLVRGLGKRALVGAGGLVLGLVGLFLLWQTAEHGAMLVFRYGVGVAAVPESASVAAPARPVGETGFAPLEDGGWSWQPTSPSRWRDAITVQVGNTGDLLPSIAADDEFGDVLNLETAGDTTLFTLGDALGSLQFDVTLNLDALEGDVTLVHNFEDAHNYHFVTITRKEMRQGRILDGERVVFDERSVDRSGWRSIRVVGDGTHYRAYDNRQLTTHGHGTAASTGPTGVMITGRGTVAVATITVVPL